MCYLTPNSLNTLIFKLNIMIIHTLNMCTTQGGGGGRALIFQTYVGSGHFFWFEILYFNIFGVFRKNKILWIFLWGLSRNWTIFRDHFIHFRVFFYGKGTECGAFFGVAKISNIFLECLKFLIFLGVNGRC